MQSADPAVFFQDLGLTVMNACYDLPMYVDQQGNTQPMLATSMDQSPDLKTVTMRLQSGINFQDGTPVNAEAVKYTVERTIGVASGVSSYYGNVKSVEAKDDTTVVFRMKTPDRTFLRQLAAPWALRVVSPTTVKAHATKDDPWAQKWMETHTAGSGPYELTKYSSTEYELQAVDGYWGEPAAIKTIRIKVVPNFTSQVLRLQSEQTSLMITGVPLKTLPQLLDKGFELNEMVNPDRTQMFINEHTPAFATAEARNAIAAAIDRATIVKNVYGDYGAFAENVWTVDPPGNPSKYPVTYDLERAKQYVASMPASDRSLTLQYVNDTPEQQTVALQIGAALNAAGLDVKVEAVTQPETFGYPTAKLDTLPDMLIVDFTGGSTTSYLNFPRVFLGNPAKSPVMGLYFGGLSYLQPTQTSQADLLMAQANRTVDQAESDDLYSQAAKMQAESGLWIPIVDRPQLTVSQAGLTGFDKMLLAPNTFQPNLVK